MTNQEAKQAITNPEGKCYGCGKTSHRATSRQLWKCYYAIQCKALK